MLCLPQACVALEEVHSAVLVTVPCSARLSVLPLNAGGGRDGDFAPSLGLMPVLDPSVTLALLPTASPLACLFAPALLA